MQEKLIIIRKRNNTNQETLAKLLDITTKSYSQKELGKTEFTMNEMFLISDYFKLSIEEIFLPSILQNGVKQEQE